MTKEKLLSLHQKLISGEINLVQEIKELSALTDEEIDTVLKCKNKKEIIKLLENEDFKKSLLNSETNIYNIDLAISNGKHIYYAIKVLTDKTILEKGSIYALIAFFSVLDAKGELQAQYAFQVASNSNAINSGHAIDLIDIISKCEGEKELISFAYYAAVDSHITRNKRVVDIVRLIASSKNKEEAIQTLNQELAFAKNLTLLDSLLKNNIIGINFFELYLENPNAALELLENVPMSADLGTNPVIFKDKTKQYSKIRTKDSSYIIKIKEDNS